MDENVAAFRRLIERGFSEGDLSVVDETVAPNCIEHQRGLKPGAEGVKDTIRTLRAWFSDFRLTIEDLTVDGDLIWARNVGRGVNTGSIMGRPATGKAVAVDVIDLVRFAEGKIVEHWGVPDQIGMMLQLGLVPRPQAAPA
jgi:predicted ester cyclase